MWTNYLKVALRNLFRYKGFSLINIFGLAIGVACCILMFLFVQHELSYDRYHENSSRIFRVIRDVDGFKTAPTAFALAPALNQDFPDIKAVRVRRDRQPALLRQGEKQFLEDRNIVKVVVLFKGREMAHGDLGFAKMDEFFKLLEDVAVIEQKPKRQGYQMTMIINPIK